MPAQSQQQQKFMGMVHALKKGDIKPSDVSQSVKDAAKSMSKKDAKDFASTKHKNLPRKVKQEILNKLKEYANKMGRDHLGGDDYTSKKKGGLRDFDGYDNVDYNKDMPMDEGKYYITRNQGRGRGKSLVGGKEFRTFKDAEKEVKRLQKTQKGIAGGGSAYFVTDKKMNRLKEGMFSTLDQIRQDSKNVRDFVKNVFADRDFKKMKNDKEFIKYLKSIYEGVDESKGVPQNYMSGRTSDYHTALRGKNRDYSGGTNFKKNNHGQPDVEEDDEDQETNHLSNKQTHIKSDKLKVSEGFDKVEHLQLLNKAMRAMPGSPKQKEIIRKLNKVRKAGGMRPLKEKSIVEYAQRLDFSFIPDEESKLDEAKVETERYFGKKGIIIMIRDGNKMISAIFKDKKNADKFNRNKPADVKKLVQLAKKTKYPKAIDESVNEELSQAEIDKLKKIEKELKNASDIHKSQSDALAKGSKMHAAQADRINKMYEKLQQRKESIVNEVGVFPVTNYIKGIIPQGRLDTNTPENRRKSEKLVKDLRNTLNKFWKQHDIPFKIK